MIISLTGADPFGEDDPEAAVVTLGIEELGRFLRALAAARRTERRQRAAGPPAAPPPTLRPWEA